jgi:hypothetical protein
MRSLEGKRKALVLEGQVPHIQDAVCENNTAS